MFVQLILDFYLLNLQNVAEATVEAQAIVEAQHEPIAGINLTLYAPVDFDLCPLLQLDNNITIYLLQTIWAKLVTSISS